MKQPIEHPLTGERRSRAAWARALNISHNALTCRLRAWPLDRALSVLGTGQRGAPCRVEADHELVTVALACECGARCERVLLSIRRALADARCDGCRLRGRMRLARVVGETPGAGA